MKKYLIKSTSVGTAANPNFAGVSKVWYSGRNSSSDILASVFEEDVSDVKFAIRRLAATCGYDSQRGAKIGLFHINKSLAEESAKYGHHEFTSEIIEVEC